MRILVSHECSGRVREALRARGHDAWSNDLLPATDGSPFHIQADALQVAYGQTWDGIVAHPVCTYLTNSAAWAYGDGPYHQHCKPGTLLGAACRAARAEAVAFFMALWNAPIARKVFENPVGYMNTHWRAPDQIVQPWQFGDDASKATCLWIEGLPHLETRPEDYVKPRMVEGRPRWANQTDSGQNRLSPGESRAADRAVTYPGIARAIAGLFTTEV
jgi:hypothetical protein